MGFIVKVIYAVCVDDYILSVTMNVGWITNTREVWFVCETTQRCAITGIILGMGLANERRCYIVMLSLIGWAHTQHDPCINLLTNLHACLKRIMELHMHSVQAEESQILYTKLDSISIFLLKKIN